MDMTKVTLTVSSEIMLFKKVPRCKIGEGEYKKRNREAVEEDEGMREGNKGEDEREIGDEERG